VVFAFGSKKHPFLDQIGKDADVLLPLADAHFVYPNTIHLTKIILCIRRLYLPEKHPPKPRIGFPNRLGNFAHGHFPHQEQRKGFKLLGEVLAQPFPRRTDTENVTAFATFATGQTTGYFTTMLENI
jgi:hypothetical protein